MAPLTAKDELTVWNRMYAKASTRPMPRFTPMPPRIFFDDRHTPRNVRINAVAMAENRLAVMPARLKNDWWFQAVYLSVPPPAGATMDDIEEAKLPEFYRMWTVIRGLTKDPTRGPDVIRRLKAKGCSVWTYECARYMQSKPVLSYYRFYPMEAYMMGLDGAAVWTSGTRQGDAMAF